MIDRCLPWSGGDQLKHYGCPGAMKRIGIGTDEYLDDELHDREGQCRKSRSKVKQQPNRKDMPREGRQMGC